MITINGEAWHVVAVTPDHPKLQRSDGSWTIGACDGAVNTIYIADYLSEQQIRKVLSHELTHAAMFSYGIELTLEQEELLADLVATYGQEIVCKTNIFFSRLKENREAFC